MRIFPEGMPKWMLKRNDAYVKDQLRDAFENSNHCVVPKGYDLYAGRTIELLVLVEDLPKTERLTDHTFFLAEADGMNAKNHFTTDSWEEALNYMDQHSKTQDQ